MHTIGINILDKCFSVNSLTRKGLYKETFNSMFIYGWKYYARQLLKQCHVSIFNLDVLENIYEMDEVQVEKIIFEVIGIIGFQFFNCTNIIHILFL